MSMRVYECERGYTCIRVCEHHTSIDTCANLYEVIEQCEQRREREGHRKTRHVAELDHYTCVGV